ncbi:hypothetical protein NC653_011457 [Populus alba x Populus x berolinensis]|uniref:Uncharacterized protein n=1 Tax=Populus alba x Populus x berolinensis TaxID=444605 RepID=A0AAD6R298_9ROSI|nr:hypothetical protein NC653_011457 [Populus alba x Populus x berolinensis]
MAPPAVPGGGAVAAGGGQQGQGQQRQQQGGMGQTITGIIRMAVFCFTPSFSSLYTYSLFFHSSILFLQGCLLKVAGFSPPCVTEESEACSMRRVKLQSENRY